MALCETPVLAYPTRNDEFVLYTDAIVEFMGSVLSQRQACGEKVIAYAAKICNHTQARYCRIQLAVVTFVKQFHHYLWGRPFTSIIDHASLTWLLKVKEAYRPSKRVRVGPFNQDNGTCPENPGSSTQTSESAADQVHSG